MAMKDLIAYLNYGKCDCDVDYREEIGVVNGVCPKHPNSELMVKGVRVGVFLKELEKRKLDKKGSKVV